MYEYDKMSHQSHSSTSIADGTVSSISNIETTSDTAQLLSHEDASTSNYTQLNKSVNFEVCRSIISFETIYKTSVLVLLLLLCCFYLCRPFNIVMSIRLHAFVDITH